MAARRPSWIVRSKKSHVHKRPIVLNMCTKFERNRPSRFRDIRIPAKPIAYAQAVYRRMYTTDPFTHVLLCARRCFVGNEPPKSLLSIHASLAAPRYVSKPLHRCSAAIFRVSSSVEKPYCNCYVFYQGFVTMGQKPSCNRSVSYYFYYYSSAY